MRHKGYFWTEVMGRAVKIVVWVHIVTGDTSGHNELCQNYNKFTGVPTPHLIDEEGLSLESIKDRFASDDNIYAVIHAASDYLPWIKLDKEFVSPFKFGLAKDCLQFVQANSIIGPLFVFKNYGGKCAANKDKWFCVLPRRRWTQYFSRRIKYE